MTPEILSIASTVIALAVLAGGLVAFLRSNKTEVTRIQDETIKAFKERLEILEKKQSDLEKDNQRLEQTIETIKAALKQKGIHITIDGDMVIIEDSSSISAKRRAATRVKDNS